MSVVWNLPGWQWSPDPTADVLECDLCGAYADEQSGEDVENERLQAEPLPVIVLCEECRAEKEADDAR